MLHASSYNTSFAKVSGRCTDIRLLLVVRDPLSFVSKVAVYIYIPFFIPVLNFACVHMFYAALF